MIVGLSPISKCAWITAAAKLIVSVDVSGTKAAVWTPAVGSKHPLVGYATLKLSVFSDETQEAKLQGFPIMAELSDVWEI